MNLPGKISNLLVALFFVVVIISMFSGALFSGGEKIATEKSSEIFSIYMPFNIFAFSEISRGNFPLWNPYVYSGIPYFVNKETALLYPVSWLNLILSPAQALNWGVALHMFLGAFLMYVWCRVRGTGIVPASLGGSLMVFCAPQFLYTARAGVSLLYTFTWTPLLFLSIDGILGGRKIERWTLLGAIAVIFQIFAGHTQYVFYEFIVAAVYTFFSIVLVRRSGTNILLIAAAFLTVYVLGAAVTAVQLLPSWIFTAETVRGGGVAYDFAALFSFPAENLLTLFSPSIFGDDIFFPYWGRWFYWEMTVFVGIGGLTLAVYGLFSRGKTRMAPVALTTLTCFVLAMGSYTPLFRFLYSSVPGFDLFRGSAKFIFLSSMFLCLIAGIGFDRLLRHCNRERPRGNKGVVLTVIVGLLCAGVLFLLSVLISMPFSGKTSVQWHRYMGNLDGSQRVAAFRNVRNNYEFVDDAGIYASDRLRTSAVKLLLFSVLIFMGTRYRRFNYIVGILAILEIIAFAHANRTMTKMPRISYSPGVDRFLEKEEGDYRIFYPRRWENAAMIDEHKVLWGYNLLPSKRYAEFMFFTQGHPADEAGEFLWMDRYNLLYGFLRCRYMVFEKGDMLKKAVPETTVDGVAIYHTPVELPPVFLVNRWRVITDRDDILETLHSDDFQPYEEVIIEGSPGISAEGSEIELSRAVLDVEKDSRGDMTIRLDTEIPVLVVVTDPYYEGCYAEDIADGDTTYKVLPANYILRAIPVDAGKHVIRHGYRPPGLISGLCISVGAVLVLLIAFIYAIIRKRM